MVIATIFGGSTTGSATSPRTKLLVIKKVDYCQTPDVRRFPHRYPHRFAISLEWCSCAMYQMPRRHCQEYVRINNPATDNYSTCHPKTSPAICMIRMNTAFENLKSKCAHTDPQQQNHLVQAIPLICVHRSRSLL